MAPVSLGLNYRLFFKGRDFLLERGV